VLPVLLLAALLQMFGTGRAAQLGGALAGFSLLFIGIDAMQAGMAAFEGAVTPENFPGDSLFGRLQLVLIGFAVTAITQSSSAGVAAALAALGAGTISFPQAAAMVIGMNVGTTCTALLATLGGSTSTRRTGYAHLIFNLVTGAIAMALLEPFNALIEGVVGRGDGLIALVTFHTAFNALGVALFLPFTDAFAGLVTRLVRERGPTLTRRLGRHILRDPDAATDAAAATVEEIARAHYDFLARRLGHGAARRADQAELRDIADALAATRTFIDKIAPGTADSPRARRIVAALHMLDHLGRLYYRCTQTERLITLGTEGRLRRLRTVMRSLAGEAALASDPARTEVRLNKLRRILRQQRRVYRERTITMASTGRIQGEPALLRADAVRWLHRVSYHLWRIQHHLVRMRGGAAPASPMREAAVEVLED
jgi:phosphate:Na+ symporter